MPQGSRIGTFEFRFFVYMSSKAIIRIFCNFVADSIVQTLCMENSSAVVVEVIASRTLFAEKCVCVLRPSSPRPGPLLPFSPYQEVDVFLFFFCGRSRL